MTSHDVVDRIRRLTGIKKVGHAGTLDPFATGLLMMLVGKATRLSSYFVSLDKEYLVTVQFGAASTTGDIDGEIVSLENAGAGHRGGAARDTVKFHRRHQTEGARLFRGQGRRRAALPQGAPG